MPRTKNTKHTNHNPRDVSPKARVSLRLEDARAQIALAVDRMTTAAANDQARLHLENAATLINHARIIITEDLRNK